MFYLGSSQRKWQVFRDTTLFVFTLTEKDSAKIRYGISLNFFLNYERKTNKLNKNQVTQNFSNKLLNFSNSNAENVQSPLSSMTTLKADNGIKK